MPLFQTSPYLYSAGDLLYPAGSVAREERVPVLTSEAPRAPRGNFNDLAGLTAGQRLTLALDRLYDAPGDVAHEDVEVVVIDDGTISQVDASVVTADDAVAYDPAGEVVTEPTPAPEPQPPEPSYEEPAPPPPEPAPEPAPPPAADDSVTVWCESQNYGTDDNGQPILVRVCHDSLGNSWVET